VEVEVLLRACCFEFILDFSDFLLRFLVTPWIREGKVGHLVWLVAEHVLEFHYELIFLIDEIIDLREYSSPFLLGMRQNTEDWLEPLAVQLRLIIEILKCEGQLLTLRHSFH